MSNPNPSTSTRWKKGGPSPNPGGKPKAVVEIQELARQHTPQAMQALAEIVSNPEAHDSARVAAATVILDRGWGKPLQQVKLDAAGDFLKLLAGLAEGALDPAAMVDRSEPLRSASPEGHA